MMSRVVPKIFSAKHLEVFPRRLRAHLLLIRGGGQFRRAAAPIMRGPDDPSQQQPNEDDWWLPEWVTPLPEVVAFYGDNPVDVPDLTVRFVHVVHPLQPLKSD